MQTTLHHTNKIGLIGGLAFRAGVFYYEQISDKSRHNDKSLRLLLNHAEVNTVLSHVASKNTKQLGQYLGSLANELFDAGAENVSITAIAPHMAIKEIKEVAKGPIISALDTIASTVNSKGIEKVAVFGTKAVMTTNIYNALPESNVIQLNSDEQEKVHNMYMDIALEGKQDSTPEVEYLSYLAEDIKKRHGVDAIILAGTDLSSFYAKKKPEYLHLDMARLHIEQILNLH